MVVEIERAWQVRKSDFLRKVACKIKSRLYRTNRATVLYLFHRLCLHCVRIALARCKTIVSDRKLESWFVRPPHHGGYVISDQP